MGWVIGLRQILRAADGMVTSQDINTRSIREAAATGCKIIRVPHASDIREWRGMFATGLGRDTRSWAEWEFNPETTGREFKKVLDRCKF